MDKRKNYYLVLDVEGAGDTQNAFVYDIGCAIADKQGKVYEKLRGEEVAEAYIINEAYTNLEITNLDAEIIWDMFKKEKEVE